jgi:hypothetical protein
VLVDKLREIDSEANKKSNKNNSIRSTFRKEMKKVCVSKWSRHGGGPGDPKIRCQYPAFRRVQSKNCELHLVEEWGLYGRNEKKNLVQQRKHLINIKRKHTKLNVIFILLWR